MPPDTLRLARGNAMCRSNGLNRRARKSSMIYFGGWTNYFRHVCAKKTFCYVSHNIFQALWRWAKQRHPNKNMRWIKNKYFRSIAARNWVFATRIKLNDGNTAILKLFDAGLVHIKRHTKIKAEATPYNRKR
jgi:RNA-directed DNA polymerase